MLAGILPGDRVPVERVVDSDGVVEEEIINCLSEDEVEEEEEEED